MYVESNKSNLHPRMIWMISDKSLEMISREVGLEGGQSNFKTPWMYKFYYLYYQFHLEQLLMSITID